MRLSDYKLPSAVREFLSSKAELTSLLVLILSAALSVFLVIQPFNFLSIIEERGGSLFWAFMPDDGVEERITIVSIDERSLSEIGPWPWPRDTMADLAVAIDNAGAQLQIHDIVYPARENDQLFAQALEQGQRAIVAQLPIIQSNITVAQGSGLTHPINGLSCGPQGGTGLFPTTNKYIASSDALLNVSKGHIAPIIDADGSIRRVPAVICVDGSPFPALAISPFLKLDGGQPWSASVEPGAGFLDPERILRLGSLLGLEVPLDGDGSFRISFARSPESFRSISAVDVIRGNFEPELLDNVLVLVGATAFGLDDIVPTPFSGFTPGVELQARAITSILDSNVPYTPRGAAWVIAAIFIFLGSLLYLVAQKRGRLAVFGLPAAAVLAPFVSLGIHGFLLLGYGFWVGWMLPGAFGFLSGLMLLVAELGRVRFERGRVMQNLTSYLPSAAAKKVALELPSSNIEAERCDVTLLSADLRNFSALSERRPPEESASVLHYFFTKVNEIVEDCGGRVHEYKGDNVLALWDGDGIEAANRALAAALKIEKAINDNLLPEINIHGLEPLAVGIGIEHGPVLLGSIGPAHRRAHTLCGETVSVALRIQEMTVDLSTPILVGEIAARYLSNVKLESMGRYLLPGLVNMHALYTPESFFSPSKENLTLLKGGLG